MKGRAAPDPGPETRFDVVFDVDGVISPLSLDNPAQTYRAWWPDPTFTRAGGLSVWYSPTLVARLNALTALPHVRPYWLTSWRGDAPTFLAPAIGLDATAWPVLDAPDTEARTRDWWKADALAAHLLISDADTVIWIDDDIREWVEEHPEVPGLVKDPRVKAISPRTHLGLLPRHLDAIESLTGAAVNLAGPLRTAG